MTLVLLFFVGLADPPPADAKPPEAAKKPDTPAEEVAAIRKEFESKRQQVFKAYMAAKTDEDKQKALKELPNAASYATRMLAVAEKHPKDPVAIDALAWVVQNGRGTPESERAMDVLLRDHLDSPKIAQLAMFLSPRDPASEKRLRTMIEKSPNKEVRGQAMFSLGQMHKRNAERTGVAQAEVERLNKQAKQEFEEVVAKYADLKHYRGSLGKAAQAELYELSHLAIGMLAPDITGKDVEGKEFKLSEYRGKVVLLDFWGNW